MWGTNIQRTLKRTFCKRTFVAVTVLSDPQAIGNFFVALSGTISTNATFDRESNKTFYRIFITAFDGAPAWNSASEPNTQDFQCDIQVIDVNDVPPGKCQRTGEICRIVVLFL